MEAFKDIYILKSNLELELEQWHLQKPCPTLRFMSILKWTCKVRHFVIMNNRIMCPKLKLSQRLNQIPKAHFLNINLFSYVIFFFYILTWASGKTFTEITLGSLITRLKFLQISESQVFILKEISYTWSTSSVHLWRDRSFKTDLLSYSVVPKEIECSRLTCLPTQQFKINLTSTQSIGSLRPWVIDMSLHSLILDRIIFDVVFRNSELRR